MAATADDKREVQYFDSDFSFEDHALECNQQNQCDNNTSTKQLTENDEALLPQSQSNAWNAFHTNHSAGNFYKARRYLTKSFPCILQYFTKYTMQQQGNKDDDKEEDIHQRTAITQKNEERDDVRIILEIGCGSGSSCIPILKQCAEIEEFPTTIEEENGIDVQRILLACDSSSVAVDTTQRYIAKFIEKEKETADDNTKRKSSDILFDAFVSDPSLKDEEADTSFLQDVTAAYEKLMSKEDDQNDNNYMIEFEKGIAGIVVMVFVLSAVTPPRVDRFLEQVYQTTSPGGLVCFRDYGLYDMPMLRFDDNANVTCSTEMSDDQVFVRGEGTIARFFSIETTKRLFGLAGFETIECRYCTVFNNNRKTGQQLKRVFVHGVFKKPI